PPPTNCAPRVKTTAAAEIAAKMATRNCGSVKVLTKSMTVAASEVELDHAIHHEGAHGHQDCGDAEPDMADIGGDERLHVIGRGQRDEAAHDEGQRADDQRRGL